MIRAMRHYHRVARRRAANRDWGFGHLVMVVVMKIRDTQFNNLVNAQLSATIGTRQMLANNRLRLAQNEIFFSEICKSSTQQYAILFILFPIIILSISFQVY